MPSPAPLDYEADPRAVVEALLERLALDPADVGLYKQLWEAALRYKAGGGPPLGLFATLGKPPAQPTARLLYYCRLWAFDPLNPQRMIDVHNAAVACETPEGTFEPVLIWIKRKVQSHLPRV